VLTHTHASRTGRRGKAGGKAVEKGKRKRCRQFVCACEAIYAFYALSFLRGIFLVPG